MRSQYSRFRTICSRTAAAAPPYGRRVLGRRIRHCGNSRPEGPGSFTSRVAPVENVRTLSAGRTIPSSPAGAGANRKRTGKGSGNGTARRVRRSAYEFVCLEGIRPSAETNHVQVQPKNLLTLQNLLRARGDCTKSGGIRGYHGCSFPYHRRGDDR